MAQRKVRRESESHPRRINAAAQSSRISATTQRSGRAGRRRHARRRGVSHVSDRHGDAVPQLSVLAGWDRHGHHAGEAIQRPVVTGERDRRRCSGRAEARRDRRVPRAREGVAPTMKVSATVTVDPTGILVELRLDADRVLAVPAGRRGAVLRIVPHLADLQVAKRRLRRCVACEWWCYADMFCESGDRFIDLSHKPSDRIHVVERGGGVVLCRRHLGVVGVGLGDWSIRRRSGICFDELAGEAERDRRSCRKRGN